MKQLYSVGVFARGIVISVKVTQSLSYPNSPSIGGGSRRRRDN